MMNARLARSEDNEAIYRIWKECFGDGEEFVSGFFAALGHVVSTLVLEDEKGVFGMGHLLPMGELVTPEGERTPCAVTYALGVSSERRSAGGGELLSRELYALAREKGFLPVICPAEESLFGYYREKVGYKTAFFAEEAVFDAEKNGAEVTEIDAEEYLELREKILENRAHIAVSEDIMKYQQSLCRASRGGLFKVTADGETAVAAVENWEGPRAKEVLSPFGVEKAAAAAADYLGAGFIRARFPGNGPFAMSAKEGCPGAWFGFAFD